MLAGLVLLGGGGAGAYWMTNRAPAEGAAAKAPEPKEEGIVAFEPFVVNLADEGGARFLRVTLRLVVEGADEAKELEENAVDHARVRSSILELLATQTADQLVTPEGKVALKKEITERATHALHNIKVADVLFTEFVVQF